jgi:hypothetical protein
MFRCEGCGAGVPSECKCAENARAARERAQAEASEAEAGVAFNTLFASWLREDGNPEGLEKSRRLCRDAFLAGWRLSRESPL